MLVRPVCVCGFGSGADVAKRTAGDEAVISYGESLANSELRDRYGFDLGASNDNGEEPPKKRDPYASLAPAPQ
jgi:hypothetical protein